MRGWKGGSNLSLYLAVCVVRGLAIDGRTQELVDGLMDHLEERRNDNGVGDWDWKNIESHVIDRLVECGMEQSKQAMERIAGVFLTNNASCAALYEGEENGFGLFPVFSILSHSCLPN